MCGIKTVVLPEHLYEDDVYDKWGDQILPNGQRLRGELFWDPSVHNVLEPVLHLFSPYTKAPRTWRLPWCPDDSGDDKVLKDVSGLEGRNVVVTAKMDGENISLYGSNGYVHARKVEPLNTPNSERIKALAAELGPDLPEGWRLCGESIIRQHTIHYQNLRAHHRWYLNVFNLWDDKNECLSWDQICEWSELLNLPMVPVLYRGPWNQKLIQSLFRPEFENDPMEGYVVRIEDGFQFRDYRKFVGKFVRPKFQQPQTHKWRYAKPVFNKPRGD